jgi:hypothetical protein
MQLPGPSAPGQLIWFGPHEVQFPKEPPGENVPGGQVWQRWPPVLEDREPGVAAEAMTVTADRVVSYHSPATLLNDAQSPTHSEVTGRRVALPASALPSPWLPASMAEAGIHDLCSSVTSINCQSVVVAYLNGAAWTESLCITCHNTSIPAHRSCNCWPSLCKDFVTSADKLSKLLYCMCHSHLCRIVLISINQWVCSTVPTPPHSHHSR